MGESTRLITAVCDHLPVTERDENAARKAAEKLYVAAALAHQAALTAEEIAAALRRGRDFAEQSAESLARSREGRSPEAVARFEAWKRANAHRINPERVASSRTTAA